MKCRVIARLVYFTACHALRSTAQSPAPAPRLDASALVPRRPTWAGAPRMAAGAFWYPFHLRRKPSCGVPTRRRLFANYNQVFLVASRRVFLSALLPSVFLALRA